MGNFNQDPKGLSDEDMDQSLQQDIAAANFAASGGDLGNYTFGENFVNDADNPGYTGTSTNIDQAVADMQGLFNTQRGITALNPYGKEGFFTRVLGIDPSKIDYSSNMDLNTRSSIANNQFSKYMNPQNIAGQIGFNRAYDSAEEGKLRAGVQDAGYQTVYGPVMEQARKQGTGEMIARGLVGMAGLPGLALGQIGTKEYGLPGVDGFSFDPNNPRPGGGILGQFLGGLNPTQAKDALVGAFAPVVPAPKPTSIGTTNSAINSWSAGRDAAKKQAQADAVSSITSQMQTNPRIANLSLEDKKRAINELAEINYQPYLDAMPAIGSSESQQLLDVFSMALPESESKTLENVQPQYPAAGNFGAPYAGEQLAGNFFEDTIFENNLSDEAKQILEENGMTIQDLLTPRPQVPEESKPNIMEMIRNIRPIT